MPAFTTGALIVVLKSASVRPAALVRMPGPFTVVPVSVRLSDALVKSVVKVAVADTKPSVPVPVSVPPLFVKAVLEVVNARPAPIVRVPVLVRPPPLWLRSRFPPLTSSVPLFVWTPPVRPQVVACAIVIRPWLSTAALSVRVPPPSASAVIVAPGALTSVPAVTAKVVPKPGLVSSIAPRLVKPVATVKVTKPVVPSLRARTTEVAVVVRAPLRFTVALPVSVPAFTTGALIVELNSEAVAVFTRLPAPFNVAPFIANTPVPCVRNCPAIVSVRDESASVCAPLLPPTVMNVPLNVVSRLTV